MPPPALSSRQGGFGPTTMTKGPIVLTALKPPAPGSLLFAAAESSSPLRDKVVAVIGYGTMGRAQALNLRDSGLAVVIGSRPESPSGLAAAEKGFQVLTVGEATGAAAVVMLMLPDEAMASVYTETIAPRLGPRAALGFAHGFAITHAQVVPEEGQPCFLVAPKGQGDKLREAYVAGDGLPGLLAITDSSPPETWSLATAYAQAIGCLRGGGLVTTFAEECVADQFGEQVVLCGGVIELLQAAFDTLVERGYNAENAYFECVHELKIITDLLHRHGIDGMRQRISGTAAYGGLTRGPRVIDAGTRRRLGEILDEIVAGDFAAELLDRHADPERGTAALARREAASALVRTGRALTARLRDAAASKRGQDDGA